MRFSLALGLSLVSVAGLAACGDDGGKSNPDGHVVVHDSAHDGSGSSGSDATSGACLVDTDLGAVDGSQTAFTYDSTQDLYEGDAALNADTAPDILDISLYNMYGAFTGGFPTTFPASVDISGDETDFTTCGACVQIAGDATQDSGDGADYMANAGTLTLNALSNSAIDISLSNVTLRHVDYTVNSSMQVTAQADDADGCMSSVGSYSYSGTVSAASFEGRGGGALHVKLHRTRAVRHGHDRAGKE
ncbi:MAG TPA: hypothetical protein VGM88_14115 [Kofleriaceae bacterium]|jgi:hypothetical protein